jgi:hypothetical protein
MSRRRRYQKVKPGILKSSANILATLNQESMTLIQLYQDFTEWLQQNRAVRVTTVRADEQPETHIRNPLRLDLELTINALQRVNRPDSPLLIHTLELRDGQWQLTVGGSYQQVKPGIYDLFGTLQLTVSTIKPAEQASLLCPYCYCLFFGIDAEACQHLVLRASPVGHWAPAIDQLINDFNQKMDQSLNSYEQFNRFLKANPQMEWRRLCHKEIGHTETVEIIAIVSAQADLLCEHFSLWLQKRALSGSNRRTMRALRVTERRRLVKVQIDKDLENRSSCRSRD